MLQAKCKRVLLRVADMEAERYIDLDKLDLAATRSRRAGSVHDVTRDTTISCTKIEKLICQLKVFICLDVDGPTGGVR